MRPFCIQVWQRRLGLQRESEHQPVQARRLRYEEAKPNSRTSPGAGATLVSWDVARNLTAPRRVAPGVNGIVVIEHEWQTSRIAR
jgi:hypothetical protein